jgi:hypothetical protein
MSIYTKQDYRLAYIYVNKERAKGELFNDFMGALNAARRNRINSTPLMRRIIRGHYK